MKITKTSVLPVLVGVALSALACLLWNVFCRSLDAEDAEVFAPTTSELELEHLLNVYEDLAASLDDIADSSDADLLAAQVALDLLQLQGTGRIEVDASCVSEEVVHSFSKRFQEARQAIDTAVDILKDEDCHGSPALRAALMFYRGMVEAAPVAPLEAKKAIYDVLANNRDMILYMLSEVGSDVNAQTVVPLIAEIRGQNAALQTAAQAYGDAALSEEQQADVAQRREDFFADLAFYRQALESNQYYGCEALQHCVESLAAEEKQD